MTMATTWLETVCKSASLTRHGLEHFLVVSVSILCTHCANLSSIHFINTFVIVVDCGDPGLPLNAARVLTGTTFSSRVTYTCSVNFMLSGEETRVCQADGTWSGALPTCERMFVCVFVMCLCLHPCLLLAVRFRVQKAIA